MVGARKMGIIHSTLSTCRESFDDAGVARFIPYTAVLHGWKHRNKETSGNLYTNINIHTLRHLCIHHIWLWTRASGRKNSGAEPHSSSGPPSLGQCAVGALMKKKRWIPPNHGDRRSPTVTNDTPLCIKPTTAFGLPDHARTAAL